MSSSIDLLKRHSLIIGLLLMFLLTWPIDLANSGVLPIHFPFLVYLFLGWGFVAAALIMTGLTMGKPEVTALLKRYLRWRVGWNWYAVAFGLSPLISIAGVYLYGALYHTAPDFNTIMAYKLFGKSAPLPFFVVPFFLIDLLSNGEEIGWRGYVLPRLQSHYNALVSTLILGAISGFWHLPKFLGHFSAISFSWFLVHIFAFAVFQTWIYNSTKGSLLLVAISHAAGNTASIFLPTANTTTGENMGAYVAITLLELLAAVIVVVWMGPERLARAEPIRLEPG